MINKILKDIDKEECYYVGTNGCLYQDLGKEELLAIKQEIERLNNVINEFNNLITNEINESKLEGDYERVDTLEYCLATLQELKGSDKE